MSKKSALARSNVPLDRAIIDSKDDVLDREKFVDNLVSSLLNIPENEELKPITSATSVVMGLTGAWGSGKTSILNLLKQKLEINKSVVSIYFNPWIFSNHTDLFDAFFNELRVEMGLNNEEKLLTISNSLHRYKNSIKETSGLLKSVLEISNNLSWKIIISSFVVTNLLEPALRYINNDFLETFPAAEAIIIIGVGLSIIGGLLKIFSSLNPPEKWSILKERTSLEKKILDSEVAIVVLIDELDRLENREVRAVAQLIKAVGEIKGISYLVAYDPVRVAQALGRGKGEERLRSGEAYIEKIIQYAVPLRPLFENEIYRLLIDFLSRKNFEIPANLSPDEQCILDFIVKNSRTPRDLKRLSGSYSVIEPMVRDEIRAIDVLGYCWLLTKAPQLRTKIEENFEQLVDDPGNIALIQRHSSTKQNTLIKVLGVAAADHEDLLKSLFPNFGNNAGQHYDQTAGYRISRRRNLVRLLYLGDPPGAISSVELIRIYSSSVEKIEEELCKRMDSSELGSLIDLISDYLPKLPVEGDDNFWVALIRVLSRPSDWLDKPDPRSGYAEDAATYLFRFGSKNGEQLERSKKIIAVLIAHGDLILTPWILRKHMFIHGFAGQTKRPQPTMIFTQDETEQLMKTELVRYQAAIHEGVWLRRCPNPESLFCLVNSDNWHSNDRLSLTAQLRNPEARATFAAMLVPPGFITGSETMATLVDTYEVGEFLTRDINASRDPWIKASLKRLQSVLNGKDPLFIEEDDDLE